MTPLATEILATPHLASDQAAGHLAASAATGPVVLIDDGKCELAGLVTALAPHLRGRSLLVRAARTPGPWLDALAALALDLTLDCYVSENANAPQTALTGKGDLAPIVALTEAAKAAGLAVRWVLPLTPHIVYRLDSLTFTAPLFFHFTRVLVA